MNPKSKFTFKPKYYRRQPYANVILDREDQIRLTGASVVENPCKTTYKGHLVSGSAHKETAGTVEKWRPDNPTVDKQVVIFDPLNFPNGKFDTQDEAIRHSIKYGEWIVDHPLALESALAEGDD